MQPDTPDVIAAADGVVAEPSGERIVVLHPDGRNISTLSPVGSVIWRCLPATRQHLVGELSASYPSVDVEALTSDLDAFIDDLRSRGLIGTSDAPD